MITRESWAAFLSLTSALWKSVQWGGKIADSPAAGALC